MVPARRLRKGWMMASRTFLPRRQRGDALQTRRHLRRIEERLGAVALELNQLRKLLEAERSASGAIGADMSPPATQALRTGILLETDNQLAQSRSLSLRKADSRGLAQAPSLSAKPDIKPQLDVRREILAASIAKSLSRTGPLGKHVLTLLCENAGQFVTVDVLAWAASEGRKPVGAATIRAYIFHIRAALAASELAGVIETGRKSYALQAGAAVLVERVLAYA